MPCRRPRWLNERLGEYTHEMSLQNSEPVANLRLPYRNLEWVTLHRIHAFGKVINLSTILLHFAESHNNFRQIIGVFAKEFLAQVFTIRLDIKRRT